MKYETWTFDAAMEDEKPEKKKKKRSIEDNLHKELTDPEVGNLLEARKKWQEEFENREKENKELLKKAEEKGDLVYKKKRGI